MAESSKSTESNTLFSILTARDFINMVNNKFIYYTLDSIVDFPCRTIKEAKP